MEKLMQSLKKFGWSVKTLNINLHFWRLTGASETAEGGVAGLFLIKHMSNTQNISTMIDWNNIKELN